METIEDRTLRDMVKDRDEQLKVKQDEVDALRAQLDRWRVLDHTDAEHLRGDLNELGKTLAEKQLELDTWRITSEKYAETIAELRATIVGDQLEIKRLRDLMVNPVVTVDASNMTFEEATAAAAALQERLKFRDELGMFSGVAKPAGREPGGMESEFGLAMQMELKKEDADKTAHTYYYDGKTKGILCAWDGCLKELNEKRLESKAERLCSYHLSVWSSKIEREPVSHYMRGGLECIDAMRAISTTTEFAAFCRLSAFKYLWRLGEKDDPAKEAKKAEVYTNWLRETLEGE